MSRWSCWLSCFLLMASLARAYDAPDPRRVQHILRYVAKDYVKAVKKHDKAELEEQVEFIEAALRDVRGLAERPGRADVEAKLSEVIALIRKGTPAERVNLHIGEAAGALSQVYPAPRALPKEHSADQGKALYVETCASCHGKSGHAETAAARAMKQHPPRLAGQGVRLAVPDVYDAVTYGMPGTPMPSFADVLTEQQRWDIAFHVLTLRK